MRDRVQAWRRRLLPGMVATTAAIALTACGGSSGSSKPVALAKTCSQINLSKPPSTPVHMRIGRGVAAEEPLWLMDAMPSVTKYQGKWYTMTMTPYQSDPTRLVAYEAGQLDGGSTTSQGFITGTARGLLHLSAVATIALEADPNAFSTTFVARNGSGINSVRDLKGKRIGTVGPNTDTEELAKAAVKAGGFNPQTDAQYIDLPFPTQAQALHAGQIDVAALPEPFFTLAMAKGGIHPVFNAYQVMGFSFDLLTLVFQNSFIQQHPGAVCAFRDDFQSAMAYYQAHKTQARTILAEKRFVKLPLAIYLKTPDYGRPPNGDFNPQALQKLISKSISLGVFQPTDRISVRRLYVPGITAGQ